MTSDSTTSGTGEKSRLGRLADFLFEAGMLYKTPRTGFQFLGSHDESVAEHSFRTAVIGYILADMAGADTDKTAIMCLFHDFHEARVGDFNYVNRIYNTSRPVDALIDALKGTGLTDKVLPLFEEMEEARTQEAQLAQDADQIDLILTLKQELDLGNPYAAKWLACAEPRLRTKEGLELARMIQQTDHTDWWFKGPRPEWWTRKNGADK